MSRHVDQIAIGYIARALQNPASATAVYRDAARTLMGHASDPQNMGIANDLIGWASKFHGASDVPEPGRPAAIIDFLDFLQERAEAYRQVGSPYDDMGVIARHAEIHEERTPGLPRVSITPKSVNQTTRLGDVATIKWTPTEQDILAGIQRTNTIAFWQGTKEESQAVTIDTSIVDQPRDANPVGGPRPYSIITFGTDGAKVDVKVDVGQRVTVVGSYVSVLVGMNPQLADFTKGQLTIAASMGFFAAPSVAPVICTEFIDDLTDGDTFIIPRPVKAMYLQPMQSNTPGGAAAIKFYGADSALVQYQVPWINGGQNVPIPLMADIQFIGVENLGGGPKFRLPFQLSM